MADVVALHIFRDPAVRRSGQDLEVRLLLWTDPTLLVIEDARDHAALVRVAARRVYPGLDVRVAGDGREGIAYLSGVPPFERRGSHPFPDLVILDLIMPGVDGFGVLDWIRSRRHPKPFPVVVLTASVKVDDRTRAMSLGASGYYEKPNDLLALGDLVAEIVETWLPSHVTSGALLRAR